MEELNLSKLYKHLKYSDEELEGNRDLLLRSLQERSVEEPLKPAESAKLTELGIDWRDQSPPCRWAVSDMTTLGRFVLQAVFDAANPTERERCRLYVDGVLVPRTDTSTVNTSTVDSRHLVKLVQSALGRIGTSRISPHPSALSRGLRDIFSTT